MSDESAPLRPPISDEEYLSAMNALVVASQLLRLHDWHGVLRRIGRSHALGPILDPTLYRRAGARLGQIEQLAHAALHFTINAGPALAALDGMPAEPDSAEVRS